MSLIPPFHSDRPSPLSSDSDPFGYLPTVVTLFEALADWHASEAPEPLVLGLFGGYGQGKSTILETLRKPLRNKKWPSISEAKFATSVEILAVESWHYQADDVDGHFSQVMARETWAQGSGTMRKIAFGTFLDFVAALKGTFSGGLTQNNLERVGADLPLFRAASEVAGDVARKGWQFMNTDVRDLAQSLLGISRKTKLVFWVDDLDRSPVEVQISFLKQIYAYRERLGVPIVVALDPSAILRGEKQFENSDLLRKVFTATLYLPGKRPEHFVEFAEQLSSEQFSEYGDGTAHQIANLISYVTSGNPRFVKRYLNTLSITAHRVKSLNADSLDSEKLLSLARWLLAQIRWPVLFGSHGDEELLFSLLRRRVLGEGSIVSFNNFLESVAGDSSLQSQCEEVMHFLRQTQGLAGQHEVKVIQWLSGKQTGNGFDWGLFWDQAESGSPNDAIETLREGPFPADFLRHFRARTARWIHRRCFSEAASMLDVFWRVVYEGMGPIDSLNATTPEGNIENLDFLMRTLAHVEVATAWRPLFTWPTLNSFLRVKDRLPDRWSLQYIDTINSVDGDFSSVRVLLMNLAASEEWTDERLRKAASLVLSWLIVNWEQQRDALAEFLINEFKNTRIGPALVSRIISRLQSSFSLSDARTPISDTFINQSRLYVWLLNSGSVISGDTSAVYYNAWFVPLESHVQADATIAKQRQAELLTIASQLLSPLFECFHGKHNESKQEAHQWLAALRRTIDWRLLKDYLGASDYGQTSDEECVTGALLIWGQAICESGILLEVEEFASALLESLQRFQTGECQRAIQGVLSCLVDTLPQSSGNRFIEIILSFDEHQVTGEQFADPWLKLLRTAASAGNHELLDKGCRRLKDADYLRCYLDNAKTVPQLPEVWVALLASDKDFCAKFSETLIAQKTVDIAASAMSLIAGSDVAGSIDVLENLLPKVAQQFSVSGVVRVRTGILASSYDVWVELSLNALEFPLLFGFEEVLRSNPPDTSAFLDQMRDREIDDLIINELFDFIPLLRAFAGAAETSNETVTRIQMLSKDIQAKFEDPGILAWLEEVENAV